MQRKRPSKGEQAPARSRLIRPSSRRRRTLNRALRSPTTMFHSPNRRQPRDASMAANSAVWT
eukprot:15126420-Heterocapsa_arctica.AAC.1